MQKINQIEEQHCKTCAIFKNVKIDYHTRHLYCIRECAVGKEIQGLGNLLLKGEKSDMAVKTAREIVFEMLDAGKSVKDIVNETDIPERTIRTYRSQYNRIRRSQDEEQLKENKENEKIKELEQINAQLRSDYESLQQKLKLAADRADEYQEQYQKLRKEYEKEVRKRKYLLAYLTLESGVI